MWPGTGLKQSSSTGSIKLLNAREREEMKQKPLKSYRQGDVLLVKIDKLPKGTNEVALDRVILAYGEATGHAHVLEREKVKPLMKHPRPDKPAWDAGAERFIEVMEAASLKHLDLPRGDRPTGEHADVPLEPGLYQVVRQREWSDEMARYVAD